MPKVIKIKKGLNINLKGSAEKIFKKLEKPERFAVKPIDFKGIIPKLKVKQGDKVKAGSVLFFDKNRPEILFTSPVSGEVKDIIRGERRKILEVVINSDEQIEYETFNIADPLELDREKVIENLLNSGVWPVIKQRPYGVVADPEEMPKAIFISAFDTAPLAPDYDFVVKEGEKDFQIGINALSKLTEGKIHVNLDATYPASSVFTNAKNVQINLFKGKHPAGNVGTQIHYIDPINKGDIVWTIDPQSVITIGRLFQKGVYDASKIIALTGSEVKKPLYYKTIMGASIKSMIENNLESNNIRCISGNVLTGAKIEKDGHVGFFDSQITIIPEGNKFDFLGWALPGFKKYSVSRSFLTWLMPGKEYRLDTNLKGGWRAFVMTGEYEKVFPLDIYPVQLIKSILVEDIDLMEKLGIYEVIEEDFALCEFVCTSKTNVQLIVQNGLELMHKEMS